MVPSPQLTLFSSQSQSSLIFKTAFFVLLLHLGVLVVGNFWNPPPPSSHIRSHVIVQTIQLHSLKNSPLPPVDLEAPSTHSQPLADSFIPPSEPLALEMEIMAQPYQEEPVPAVSNLAMEVVSPPVSSNLSEEIFSPPPTLPKKPQPADAAPLKKPSKPKIQPLNEKDKPSQQQKISVDKRVKKEKRENQPTVSKEQKKNEVKQQPAKSEVNKQKEKEKKEMDKQLQHQKQERQKELDDLKKKKQREEELKKKQQQEKDKAQEAARQKELALLTKAKENLTKMNETRDKINPATTLNLDSSMILPKELTLHVDALTAPGGEWGAKETTYSEEIASRLKMALKLPDYGTIQIKLTLDRTGKVIKVETIHSESSKNKAYVESKIPIQPFPPFGQRFPTLTQHTFIITLQNDN